MAAVATYASVVIDLLFGWREGGDCRRGHGATFFAASAFYACFWLDVGFRRHLRAQPAQHELGQWNDAHDVCRCLDQFEVRDAELFQGSTDDFYVLKSGGAVVGSSCRH